MTFLTVLSPHWTLLHPTKKVIPMTTIHCQLCWQPQLRDTAPRRWDAWAVYPPAEVFSPGQAWSVSARHTCRQLALTLPALHLPERRTQKSSGTLYNFSPFMRIKLWSQAEDAGFPLSPNPQCATRNLEWQFYTFAQGTLGLMLLMSILLLENCLSVLF